MVRCVVLCIDIQLILETTDFPSADTDFNDIVQRLNPQVIDATEERALVRNALQTLYIPHTHTLFLCFIPYTQHTTRNTQHTR